MSWICEICSSANEDYCRECFVCGQVRSKESFRKERRNKREKSLSAVFNKTDRVAGIALKTIFIVALVLCIAVLTCIVIKKIVNGNFGGVWENFQILISKCSYNATRLFLCASDLFGIRFGVTFGYFYQNVTTVFGGILPQIGFALETFFQSIIVPIYNKFAVVVTNLVSLFGFAFGRFRGA